MKDRYNKLKRTLMQELKKIYDDKDFVCGTVTIAQNESNWRKILDYIRISEQEEQEVSSDDVLALALVLRKESDSGSSKGRKYSKVAAAML